MNIILLAWKNIWRNKVRSGVILAAIAIGLFAGTFLASFLSGWMVGTVNDDVNTHLSHVQIHNEAFIANSAIDAFFMKEAVEPKIRAGGISAPMSSRLRVTGMLASPHKALGITVRGVDAADETRLSTIHTLIPDSMGSFLAEGERMPVVISRKIAEELKVKLRSKIVLTVQDAAGEMQSIAFRVGGIYKTTNAIYDEANIFVRYSDLLPYTALPEGAVHETALRFDDLETCELIAPTVTELLPDMKVQTWGELNTMLGMSLAWTDMMAVIMIGIFLLSLSFGIINTMLMAVLERTREIGMLRAIGMSRGRVFRMIMAETVLLTLFGSCIGILLGVCIIIPSMSSGIDLTFLMGDLFEDYGFGSVIYPVLNMKMFVQIICLVIATGILSAIYPARKALALKVLDAVRH
ncbi:MAG: FtsX-like permease family protein [Tannerellaceae bacterium]|jgi:ABC-type lipoprotein release transport system permease subunit|nr:FtsX-like permease family protein [Tannerellaceae bacterium]